MIGECRYSLSQQLLWSLGPGHAGLSAGPGLPVNFLRTSLARYVASDRAGCFGRDLDKTL